MADEAAKPFSEEIILLAEKLGEVTDRLARIEAEHNAQTAPLDAARGAQDSAIKSLEAALAGIKALNFHVLDNNLGAVSTRLSEVERQADAALKDLDAKIAETKRALDTLAADTVRHLDIENAQRQELSAKRDADAVEFSQRVEVVRGEIATLQKTLAERIDAARKEFAEPKGFTPKGKYLPNSVYAKLDVVEFNGSSYLSSEDGNNEQPGKSSKKWQLLARRAAAGGGGSTPEPASLQPLSDGATITWDLINPIATVTLAGSRTIAFQNARAGGTYILIAKQDVTGSRAITWPSNVRWESGVTPTLTTTASKADIIQFVYDGTVFYGSIGQNYTAS